MAYNVQEVLARLDSLDGFLGAALVDYSSGMALGKHGDPPEVDLDVAAATHAEVIKAKRRAIAALDLDDGIEDILISLNNQYHLIRIASAGRDLFFYVVLNRDEANLALARLKIRDAEAMLNI